MQWDFLKRQLEICADEAAKAAAIIEEAGKVLDAAPLSDDQAMIARLCCQNLTAPVSEVRFLYQRLRALLAESRIPQ